MTKIGREPPRPQSPANIPLDDPFAPKGGDPFAVDPFSVSPPFEFPGNPFEAVSEINVVESPFGDSPLTVGDGLDATAEDKDASATRRRRFGTKLMQIIKGDKGFVRPDSVLGDM